MELTYESTSRFIKTRLANLHINEAGDPAAETILLLHGSGPGATGWTNFSPNIAVLAQQYHVVAADMPGWGESDPVTWSDRNHVQNVLELLDALDIAKVTLIGNSMGGGTSIAFTYTHPDRVQRLITMGSSSGQPTITGAGGLTEGLKILQKGYRDPSFETMRELVEVMTFDSGFATDELIQSRADMVTRAPEHARNFLDGVGKRAVVELDWDQVKKITQPTLLFHGRDDRVVHYENSLRLSSLIPDSRVHLINRCGHWLQIEHAEEFNRLVLDFMSHH